MAAFEYTALQPDGRQTRGIVTADTPRAARKELRLRQLTPLDVKTASAAKQSRRLGGRLNSRSRALITRQLSVMLSSGMTVEEALKAASGDRDESDVARLLSQIRSRVIEGARLADAMSEAPQAFPKLYRAVVSAGESSGELAPVLARLADYLESAYRLRRQVQSALIYPAILAFMATAMVTALMIFVIPRLVEQFDVMGGADLPVLTQFVMGLSDFTRSWGWALVVVAVAAVFVLSRAKRAPVFGAAFDRLVLAMPIIGDMQKTVLAARFARIYATLSGAGAPVLEALAGAKAAMTNHVFEQAAEEIASAVREGGSFSAAMDRTKAFPVIMVHMAAAGEVGRDLPGMMNRAAEFLESEFETNAQTALGLLEPLIIVVLGGVVGLIVLSIMLPILQLNTLALG